MQSVTYSVCSLVFGMVFGCFGGSCGFVVLVFGFVFVCFGFCYFCLLVLLFC